MPTTNENKYAATQWGGAAVDDLTCPSGQMCQVRRVGPMGLIEAGVIQSLDGLTGIVQNELIPSAEGKVKIDPTKLLADTEAMASMIHVMDRIVCHVVLQPKVEMTPADITRRQDGVVYADMIDLEDKTFIMSYAMGGTKDLETFRQESADAVGSLDEESESEGKTE